MPPGQWGSYGLEPEEEEQQQVCQHATGGRPGLWSSCDGP